MRRQLNTLYVTTDGAWLRKDGANIVLEVEREERARLPAHMLEGLVCIGRVGVSPQVLGFCCEQGITISYLTLQGVFLREWKGRCQAMCCCVAPSTAPAMHRSVARPSFATCWSGKSTTSVQCWRVAGVTMVRILPMCQRSSMR